MKRTILKAGAAAGVVSVAVLAAGPALAATTVSQASAQGIDLTLAGNKLVTGVQTATNDGTQAAPGTRVTANTLPGVAGLVPGTNVAGLGVVLQDAWANPTGYSTACAGLTGQGGGLVQVGDKPCSVSGGQATSVDLASLDLGKQLASPDTIVGQVTSALKLNLVAGQLQDALVGPLTKALSNALGNVGLVGSLGVVAGHCEATPTSADGGATIADSHIGLTLGGQTVTLVDLPANPDPNTHVLTNLDKVTDVLLSAVTTEVKNALNNSTGAAGDSPLGQLGDVLSKLSAVTAILGTTVDQITSAIQDQLITTLTAALQPLLSALQDNVLDITLNKQPVPQATKTFETTALDLQVLPALKQFMNGSSLVGGDIGHVTCGPNSAVNTSPSPSPSSSPSTKVPTKIDSGQSGENSTATIIAAMSVLLAAGGAAGATAYRRYWMPRG